MNYKSAIAAPTAPPPKAVETPYLTIDEAYREFKAKQSSVSGVSTQSAHAQTLEDASDHVANTFARLATYWRQKGYLEKATVTGFCDMLKTVFQVEYMPTSDDESI